MTRPAAAELHAGDLVLGPWRDEDAAAVLAIADDPDTQAWSRSMRSVHTAADAREWMRRGMTGPERVDWAVREASTGAVVGRVGLNRFDHESRSAEIGYGVHPDHRRRGVARRAVEIVTGHGFEVRGLHRIALIHATGNPASCAVAASSGYAFEGVERENLDHGDGVLHDAHRHARLCTDPPGTVVRPPAPVQPAELTAGDDLLLRPWRGTDAATVFGAFGDPETLRWSARPPFSNLDEAHAWIASRTRAWVTGSMAAWAACDVSTGEVVGSVTLRDLDRGDAGAVASYWVRAPHRGQGIAPRVLSAVSTFAFQQLHLHRVALLHAVPNAASCRVAQKSGFGLEGTTRGSDRLSGGWVDEHLHARLATDPVRDLGADLRGRPRA